MNETSDTDVPNDERVRESQRGDSRTVLAHRRRRFVLGDLLNRVHPVPVYDLADRLSTWESEAAVSNGDSTAFEAVRRSLHEHHLPRLVDAGLVEPVDDGDRYRLTKRGLAVEAAERGYDVERISALD